MVDRGLQFPVGNIPHLSSWWSLLCLLLNTVVKGKSPVLLILCVDGFLRQVMSVLGPARWPAALLSVLLL